MEPRQSITLQICKTRDSRKSGPKSNNIGVGANPVSQTVGGETESNIICKTFKIPWPMEERRLRNDATQGSMARSYQSELKCVTNPSLRKTHIVFISLATRCSLGHSWDTSCTQEVHGQETCSLRTGTTSKRRSHRSRSEMQVLGSTSLDSTGPNYQILYPCAHGSLKQKGNVVP